MYLQWIKKSMKTKLYLVAINSPKVFQMAGKPWSIKDIKAAGNILPFPTHVDVRSTWLNLSFPWLLQVNEKKN